MKVDFEMCGKSITSVSNILRKKHLNDVEKLMFVEKSGSAASQTKRL